VVKKHDDFASQAMIKHFIGEGNAITLTLTLVHITCHLSLNRLKENIAIRARNAFRISKNSRGERSGGTPEDSTRHDECVDISLLPSLINVIGIGVQEHVGEGTSE